MSYVDDAVSVGRRLVAAREQAGLSQRALSFPGCTAAYISRIEHGERIPSLQLLRELAARLGVDEAYLARGRAGVFPLGRRAAAVRAALRLGELGTARHLTQEILDEARSPRDRATALALRGEVDLLENDLASARVAFAEAISVDAQLEAHDPDAAEALGRLYLQAGELEPAVTIFRRNLDRAILAEDPINQARFASLLASTLIDAGSFESAETLLDSLVETDEPIGDPLTLARHYLTVSQQQDALGAERSTAQAAALVAFSDYHLHAARILQLRAHLELNRGNGPRAATLLEQAAPSVDASGQHLALASFKVEQARAHLAQNNPDAARAAATEAAALLAAHNTAEAGRSFSLLADLFVALEDDEEAAELYNRALTRLGGERHWYAAHAYTNLAALHERNGNQEAAIETLKRGLNGQAGAAMSSKT